MGCGSNFRYKLKKKGHGPLSRWVDFFKWSYPNGFYLDFPHIHWISPNQHSLTSACANFFYLSHFWAVLCFFGKSLPILLLFFWNQGDSNKYSPLEPGNHYSKLPPKIPHRLLPLVVNSPLVMNFQKVLSPNHHERH
jgi:hypothetical protein